MMEQDVIPLRGGLDLINPILMKKPGTCIAALNYECNVMGYGRMDGYERYDGRGFPSRRTYTVLTFTSGSTAILEDDQIVGDTSGADWEAVYDAVVESGSWAGGDAAGYVVVQNNIGSTGYDLGEGLEVSAVNVATAADATSERNASTTALDYQYLAAAQDKQRALISAPAGSGPIRGFIKGTGSGLYAIRDNAGATAAVIHLATTSGWSALSFGEMIDFNTGSVADFVEGETINGGSSGASATVDRVVYRSGTSGGSNGIGYLIISGVTSGPFTLSETITGGTSGATGVVSVVNRDVTLPAGGKWRWQRHNFYATDHKTGVTDNARIYMANGTGWAFEYDDANDILCPIRVPGLTSTEDKPTRVAIHSNHLLLFYPGGGILCSGTGLPLSFYTTDGAAELHAGDTVTDVLSRARTSTVIACNNRILYLVGSDSSEYDLKELADDTGAREDTMVMFDDVYYMDNIGVRSLSSAERFGDWSVGTITRMIQTLFKAKQAADVSPVTAVRRQDKDQYRLYFDDKTVVSIYFGRGNPECMVQQLEFTPYIVETIGFFAGREYTFAGGTDGMVYLIDRGTSADGTAIDAYVTLAFSHQRNPNREKRYAGVRLAVANGNEALTLSHAASVSNAEASQPVVDEIDAAFAATADIADVSEWDQFAFTSPVKSEAYADIDSLGHNISNSIAHSATAEEPHTLTELTIDYSWRKKRRRA